MILEIAVQRGRTKIAYKQTRLIEVIRVVRTLVVIVHSVATPTLPNRSTKIFSAYLSSYEKVLPARRLDRVIDVFLGFYNGRIQKWHARQFPVTASSTWNERKRTRKRREREMMRSRAAVQE